MTAQPGKDLVEMIALFEHSLSPSVAVQGEPPIHWALDERMAHHRVPGVSIAVIDGDRIEWAKGYGRLEAGRESPVTREALFQAASISKPVSCLGAMRLVEQGVLSLDEPVNDRLRSWRVPENQLTRGNPVTLRRLMSHTAGLTVHGFGGYAQRQPVPSLLQVLDGVPPANSEPVRVDIAPGGQFRYSGGGTCVMQLLMEEATGRSFADLMRELVLAPLGMANSTFETLPFGTYPSTVAHAHRTDGSMIAGGWHVYPELAPAGLWTTPSDLCRFAIALQQGYEGAPGAVLSQRLVRQMLTPVAPNGWEGQESSIALGPSVFARDGVAYMGHGGSNAGFRCQLTATRGSGHGAAIMTNGDAGSLLISETMSGLGNTLGWPGMKPSSRAAFPMAAETLARYAGTYEVMPGVSGEVRAVEDHLVAAFPGMGEMDLYPASDTEFFATSEARMVIQFVRDPSGRATELQVPIAGMAARRIE